MTLVEVSTVRQRLSQLSERGVFQRVVEARRKHGKTVFQFQWLLDKDFELEVNPNKNRFVMKDVLPSVINRSHLDRALRAFIAGRASKEIPEHRRINPDDAELVYSNRKQNVSLTLNVKNDRSEYALTSFFRVINDLFIHLRLSHIDYLHKHFNLPEE